MANQNAKRQRKIDYHEHDTPEQEMFPDISNVASANECTGLMHRSPRNKAEEENYRELSSMAIPRREPEADPRPGR